MADCCFTLQIRLRRLSPKKCFDVLPRALIELSWRGFYYVLNIRAGGAIKGAVPREYVPEFPSADSVFALS